MVPFSLSITVVQPRGIRKTIQAKIEYPTMPTMNKSCKPVYTMISTPWVTATIARTNNKIETFYPDLELRHHMDGTGLSTREYVDNATNSKGVLLSVSEIYLKQQYHLFLGDDIYMANMDTTDL